MKRGALYTVFLLPLFCGCWLSTWSKAPGRVEKLEVSQAEMRVDVDSIAAGVERNQHLLRGIQAQAGMRDSGAAQQLSEMVSQLEAALARFTRARVGQDDEAGAAEPVYEDAFRQYQQGDYTRAAQGFRQVYTEYPRSVLADDALYFAALCNQALGQPHRAIEELVAVYFMYPSGDKTASALARAAAIYALHTAETERDRLEAIILQEYPQSDEARLIRQRTGR
jgi:TolA-binding protein